MEPNGFFTDTETGHLYPSVASNNTYWPREIRDMAILLGFAGVAVICRAGGRGLAIGGVGAVLWLGADLWLDRVDVDGRTAAWWLGAAGILGFAVTAGVAAWLSRGRPGTARLRYLAVGMLPLLAALTTSISTPWDEPVTDPDRVHIDNAVTVFKILLVDMLLVGIVGLVVDGLTRPRAWWFAAMLAIVLLVAGLTIGSNGQADSIGPMVLFAAGLITVAAARDIPRTTLMVVAGTAVLMSPIVILGVVVAAIIDAVVAGRAVGTERPARPSPNRRSRAV